MLLNVIVVSAHLSSAEIILNPGSLDLPSIMFDIPSNILSSVSVINMLLPLYLRSVDKSLLSYTVCPESSERS